MGSAEEATSDEEWHRALAVDTTGAFLCTLRVFPGMHAAGTEFTAEGITADTFAGYPTDTDMIGDAGLETVGQREPRGHMVTVDDVTSDLVTPPVPPAAPQRSWT